MSWNRPLRVETLAEGKTIWFVSDLHLGDGTPSDAFFGKDRHLIALVETVEENDGILVVGGDAVDFHQAWSFTRILRAHQELLSAMSRLGRAGRLYYVVGNHDYDLSLYSEILNFQVCDELRIRGRDAKGVEADRILVQHGYQYDPFLKGSLENQFSTKVHHLVERYLNTWLRIPLGEFYTRSNRVSFWIAHKYALLVWAKALLLRTLGFEATAEASQRELDFWARSNMGDPMCIFQPVMRRLDEDEFETIILGHSHLPGIVPQEGRRYINTGSWTFASSHYVTWDGSRFECRDWITGREFQAEFYQPLLDGTLDEKDFWQWWRENYMGWFRFREGEERKGRLRGWESYLRDYQHLSQLQPTLPPVPGRQIPTRTSRPAPPDEPPTVKDAKAG